MHIFPWNSCDWSCPMCTDFMICKKSPSAQQRHLQGNFHTFIFLFLFFYLDFCICVQWPASLQSIKPAYSSSSLHGRFNFQLLLLLRISRNAPDPECSTDSSYPESGSRHIQCSIDTRTVHPLTQGTSCSLSPPDFPILYSFNVF